MPLVHPVRGHSQPSVMNFSKLSACCLFRSLSENPFQHTALPVAHKNQRSQVSVRESRARCSRTSLACPLSLAVLGVGWVYPTSHQRFGTQVRLSSAGGTCRSAAALVGSGELPTALWRTWGFSQPSLPPAPLPGSLQYKLAHPDPAGQRRTLPPK